jgi:hypothetical protein
MSNQANTKLFSLIRSMTMSEKRFFKIYSSRHAVGGKNNYLLLFDLIDKMNEYDEAAVRAASFVKNSAAEKNYLYRIVLKGLNVFHAQSTTRLTVYDLLTSAEILKQKGLYQQSLIIARKARQLAEKNELLREQLLVQELEAELLLKELDYAGTLEVLEDDSTLIEKVQNMREMAALTTRAYHENLSKGVARTSEELTPFDAILHDGLLANEEQALTIRARLHQISVSLTFHMVAGNIKEQLAFAEKIVAHYESNLHLIEYTPIGYVSALFILGSSQRENKQYQEGLETAKRLGNAVELDEVKKSLKAVASSFFYQHILALKLHLQAGSHAEAKALVLNAEDKLQAFVPFIGKPQLYDLYFQFCKLFYEVGNLKKSLYYTNEILNDLDFKERDDFQVSVRLFNLIVHFDLGNDFTLDYLSRSTFNYLKKRNKLFAIEKLIVRFLEKYPSSDKSVEVKAKWSELHEKLAAFTDDPFEQRALSHFDFTAWVASKK